MGVTDSNSFPPSVLQAAAKLADACAALAAKIEEMEREFASVSFAETPQSTEAACLNAVAASG